MRFNRPINLNAFNLNMFIKIKSINKINKLAKIITNYIK